MPRNKRTDQATSSGPGWRRVVGRLMLAVLLVTFAFGGALPVSKISLIPADGHEVLVSLDQRTNTGALEHSDFCPIPAHGKHCVGHTILSAAPQTAPALDDLRKVGFPAFDGLLEPAELDPPKRPPRA